MEDWHTYFVGKTGLWVHDTNCNKAEAVEVVAYRAELQTACFPEDELVLCESGRYRKIFSLDVGDKVLSRCEKTGEVAYKRITKKYEHAGVKTLLISCSFSQEYFDRFGVYANVPIITTPEHPLWVQAKGWVRAGDLQSDDQFLTHDGLPVGVIEVSPFIVEPSVYNIEVEDFHTYFVALSGVWVHNKSVPYW